MPHPKGAAPQSPRDNLGFTPLELAQYLGQALEQPLGARVGQPSIKVQFKGQSFAQALSMEEFEKAFKLRYRHYLTFPSLAALQAAIANCPYVLRCRWLTPENYAWAELYKKELAAGSTAKIAIKWIDETLGYGAFVDEDLPAQAFVGEYTGLVRPLYRRHPDHNAYCLAYPMHIFARLFMHLFGGKYLAVDALKEGNVTRFINHSQRPNVQPLCLVDRGLLHQIFVTKRPLAKGTQLTYDYGQDYWINRQRVGNE